MEFYHINRFLFDVGTIIRPGAWGRPILSGMTYSGLRPNVNYFILFREYVFEQIRQNFILISQVASKVHLSVRIIFQPKTFGA